MPNKSLGRSGGCALFIIIGPAPLEGNRAARSTHRSVAYTYAQENRYRRSAMELLLQLIFEFFLEFILQIAAEILIELGLHKLSVAPWVRKTVDAAVAVLIYFGLGVVIGWLSLLIFPQSFIRSYRLHGISLIVTPTLAGLTMSCIGWLRTRQGSSRIRLDTFAYGFIFAFGMSLVRLLFTT